MPQAGRIVRDSGTVSLPPCAGLKGLVMRFTRMHGILHRDPATFNSSKEGDSVASRLCPDRKTGSCLAPLPATTDFRNLRTAEDWLSLDPASCSALDDPG